MMMMMMMMISLVSWNDRQVVNDSVCFSLHTPTLSVGVGRISESVCLSVCLPVYSQHNSKTNDPKVFELGVGMILGYTRSVTVLGFKGQRSRSPGGLMVTQ